MVIYSAHLQVTGHRFRDESMTRLSFSLPAVLTASVVPCFTLFQGMDILRLHGNEVGKASPFL
jgi:hypothetical protein